MKSNRKNLISEIKKRIRGPYYVTMYELKQRMIESDDEIYMEDDDIFLKKIKLLN